MARRGGGPPKWGWEPGDDDRNWGAYGNFPGHVNADERKRRAAEALKKLAIALRREPMPVPAAEGNTRKIVETFWGKAWCENLERYSDYATRLPRGRSYVREGAVVDLWIEKGRIDARVAGTEVYEVVVTVTPVAAAAWSRIREAAAGKIESLVALLGGALPDAVMELVTRREEGLFPAPKEIGFTCSCPDSARMCKHIAAVLYGIGIRFDTKPELLFALRGVDPAELVTTESVDWLTLRPPSKRVLKESALAGIFGVEIVKERETAFRTRVSAKRKRPSKRRNLRKK